MFDSTVLGYDLVESSLIQYFKIRTFCLASMGKLPVSTYKAVDAVFFIPQAMTLPTLCETLKVHCLLYNFWPPQISTP